jgi:hypothetical protein
LLVAAPSLAQSDTNHSAPVTRAQVRAELEELVNAGYNPRDWYHYPDNLWAAQRIVQQRHEALAQQKREDTGAAQAGSAVTKESYGGNAAGKSEAGAPKNDQGTWQHGAMPRSVDPQCGLYRGP